MLPNNRIIHTYHIHKRNLLTKSTYSVLISFLVIFVVKNYKNESVIKMITMCIFLIHYDFTTTIKSIMQTEWNDMIWIIFIFPHIYTKTQQNDLKHSQKDSCELLSNSCIFVIKHNTSSPSAVLGAVVNCFQIPVSLWLSTTNWAFRDTTYLLWIAFKFLYLCD